MDVKLSNISIPTLIIKDNMDTLEIIEEGLFFAPEFLHRQEITSKNDIYSFGILLYFFYACKWPYPYSQDITKLKKSLLKDPQQPKELREKMKMQRNLMKK